jgi:hypothetical protein
MAERVKPRSREAVRVFAQGFTRDDSPGENEWQQPPTAGFAICQQKAHEPQVEQGTCAKPAKKDPSRGGSGQEVRPSFAAIRKIITNGI